MENNDCLNCQDKQAIRLRLGDFTTDLFCSWACLSEYVDIADD
jgi:hypothetical protein